MLPRYVFLDMDGILADFVTGVCAAHGRPNPYNNPANHGVWDMEKLWGITVSEFFAPTRGEAFWADLPKTEEADGIVDWACSTYGVDNVAILTAPSLDPTSITGKKIWVKRYYPQLLPHMIFTPAKRFLAGVDKLLVDDRNENYVEFHLAGGKSYLFPRLWNSKHESVGSVDGVSVLRMAYGKSERTV